MPLECWRTEYGIRSTWWTFPKLRSTKSLEIYACSKFYISHDILPRVRQQHISEYWYHLTLGPIHESRSRFFFYWCFGQNERDKTLNGAFAVPSLPPSVGCLRRRSARWCRCRRRSGRGSRATRIWPGTPSRCWWRIFRLDISLYYYWFIIDIFP